ncbi:MAG: AMP-binding protein [Proteobacteria bacterium]|nr:AMP-binding protein [Pseudomonadota bacterium]
MVRSARSSAFAERLDKARDQVRPSQPFLEASDGVLTYGELFDRIDRLASLFRERGVNEGDRVLLCTQSDRECVALYMAAVRWGAAAVVADPEATADELGQLVRVTEPRLAFIDRRALDQLGSGPDADLGLGVDCVPVVTGARRGRSLRDRLLGGSPSSDAGGSAYPALLDALAPAAELPPLPAETSPAHILFTSGTTDGPKGVVVTHRSLAAHMDTLVRHYGYDATTRVLNLLPLHHTDGITQGPTLVAMTGGTVVRPFRFRVQAVDDLLEAVYRERITHLYSTPTMLSLLLRLGEDYADSFDTPDFRFVISSAGLLSEALWTEFERFFRTCVVNVYGLTETVSGSLYCGPDDATRRLGTLGKPVDCAARLVDDAGEDVPVGSAGELLLRGEHVTPGYFRQPEETQKVLRDGWLHTGDLCTCDEDGFYRMVGRKKNVIVTGGINVVPEEVSGVLRRLPGVRAAETVGVRDGVWGERVVSFVELEPDAADADTAMTPDALASGCRAHLAPEKIPHRFHVVEELPRGPAGKVLLGELRALAEKLGGGPGGGGISPDDTRRTVIRIAADCFQQPEASLAPSSSPENTDGWDSFAHMSLILDLEEAFAVRFTSRDIMSVRSLADAEEIVCEKRLTG